MPECRKSPMPHELKAGAVFITDAHYPRQREEILALFDALLSSPPPQVFLLGDMFEFLCPKLPYSLEYNKELTIKIDALSKLTELFYLEGNHDYLLGGLFKSAKVYPIQKQPLFLSYGDKTAALFHGDKYEATGYRLYSALIRNPFVIFVLRILTLDVNGRFIKSLYKKLLTKNLCRDFSGFETKKRGMLSLYPLKNIDTLVEGHYHCRVSFEKNGIKYEALGAFACNKSFFKVEFVQSDISFAELEFRSIRR
jgi:UDP-2,3-diacylglucosamine hydrolase